MSTTKRINQKKVDQIGYQRGRWAIYLFLQKYFIAGMIAGAEK